METKSIFTSKTFWTNVIALVAMVIQGITGKDVFPLEYQASALSVVNVLLRMVTKQPVTWA